jgi:ABC-2 type transport system permease protein
MLYAYVLASYTLANSFLANVTFSLSRNIRTGDFDQSMTKPLHPLVYEMANSFSDYYFLHFFLALGMVFLCAMNLSIELTFIKALMLIISIIGGALIQGGIWILFSSAAFSLINNPLNGALYNNIRPVIEYPISILPKAIQFIFCAVIPLAFVSFFPAQHLIGKDDTLFFPKIVQNLSLPVGIVFFLLSFLIWDLSMRNYKSTGS